ncbi:MAG: hypothetical protein ABR985_17295 [Methanotrichaceae archaeon]|jgi:hypothetical protein
MTDKDDLYKNLEYVSQAYYVAEGAFPLWEAVFALVEGQILVAYFSSHMHTDQKIGLAFIGLIISIIWFMLVSLNYLHASYINEKMDKLHRCLSVFEPSMPFVWPWANDNDKINWNWGDIILGRLPQGELKQGNNNRAIFRSTWIYRKALPIILAATWFGLITWQILIDLIRICDGSRF